MGGTCWSVGDRTSVIRQINTHLREGKTIDQASRLIAKSHTFQDRTVKSISTVYYRYAKRRPNPRPSKRDIQHRNELFITVNRETGEMKTWPGFEAAIMSLAKDGAVPPEITLYHAREVHATLKIVTS